MFRWPTLLPATAMAACCGLILAPAGGAIGQVAARPIAAAPSPPAPARVARVWILRQWNPMDLAGGEPVVYANGVPLAPVAAGSAFYRGLAPGTYTFSVESCSPDVGQSQTVTLPPGGEVDLEIQYLPHRTSLGCFTPGTFYVRQIAPAQARLYFGRMANLGPR